jgi:iodotyrosine deiodinase
MRDVANHIPLITTQYSEEEMMSRTKAFFEEMSKRRTVREFDTRPIPKAVLDNLIRTAGSAPSGANKQPWSFCLVQDKGIKHKIREAAEKEEYENYNGRMADRWLDDLKDFGTDHVKEFLDEAPCLIVVFKRVYEMDEHGGRHNNYYVNESVGIAVGMLLAGVQHAGLVAVTHTPSPMNFLAELLERPENERAYLLIPVGFPKEGTRVPDIKRKELEEIRGEY